VCVCLWVWTITYEVDDLLPRFLASCFTLKFRGHFSRSQEEQHAKVVVVNSSEHFASFFVRLLMLSARCGGFHSYMLYK